MNGWITIILTFSGINSLKIYYGHFLSYGHPLGKISDKRGSSVHIHCTYKNVRDVVYNLGCRAA